MVLNGSLVMMRICCNSMIQISSCYRFNLSAEFKDTVKMHNNLNFIQAAVKIVIVHVVNVCRYR